MEMWHVDVISRHSGDELGWTWMVLMVFSDLNDSMILMKVAGSGQALIMCSDADLPVWMLLEIVYVIQRAGGIATVGHTQSLAEQTALPALASQIPPHYRRTCSAGWKCIQPCCSPAPSSCLGLHLVR